MWRSWRTMPVSVLARSTILGLCLVVALGMYLKTAYGADLFQRSLQLSDSRVSQSAAYTLGFTITAPEVLGSVKVTFCSNSPLLQDVCIAPTGFDVSSATLSSQTGQAGFIILPAGTNANTITLSRAPSAAAAGTVSYTLTGVINPSSGGTYFGRVQTFTTADASGSDTDEGGLAFSINSEVQITATVPPYLLFCSGVTIGGFDCANASGNYINLGTLTDQSAASGSSQLLTATNAANGFAINVYGTTLTSGNNLIPSLATADVSRPGVAQFGLNLVANTTPAVGQDPVGPGAAAVTASYATADLYKFTSGDAIASVLTSDDYRKFTVSYIANIPKGQPIGVYASTLTYTCLANF